MNYKIIYDSIIENRKINKAEGYTEKHHIIPSCLGGSNKKENLVMLTAKEHFICHLLLTKMYEKYTLEYYKLIHAFICMSNKTKEKRYNSSRNYDYLRKENAKRLSEMRKGKQTTGTLGKKWIHNIDLEKNALLLKGDILPDGWNFGKCKSKNNQYVFIYNKESGDYKTMYINDEIPDGWGMGRKESTSVSLYKVKISEDKTTKSNICRKCGAEKGSCIDIKICRTTILQSFIEFLSFDISVLGTSKFYDEYYRIVNLLKRNYVDECMSVEDIRNLYGYTSNERVRMMLKSLGIERRSISEANKNYTANVLK